MKRHLPLVLLVLFLSACNGHKGEMDPLIYDANQVSLMVKGKTVFSYTEGTTQLTFNRTLKEFRAGNDDMSQFFVLTCSELPVKEGQELTGEIKWTSGSSVKTSSGLRFRVEKNDNTGLVWLWCASDKTGAVVKILN